MNISQDPGWTYGKFMERDRWRLTMLKRRWAFSLKCGAIYPELGEDPFISGVSCSRDSLKKISAMSTQPERIRPMGRGDVGARDGTREPSRAVGRRPTGRAVCTDAPNDMTCLAAQTCNSFFNFSLTTWASPQHRLTLSLPYETGECGAGTMTAILSPQARGAGTICLSRKR